MKIDWDEQEGIDDWNASQTLRNEPVPETRGPVTSLHNSDYVDANLGNIKNCTSSLDISYL
ncbi:uncharacterized protein N7511_002519 [Penicillium nucicola]|uniref:uncharacterized protein n=1 Tax=Penicillium nucicola TaxID=1850975 RepID=UPI002545B496|nr:uncharacterized protein N7511_002519 [Penicillium nucicola]KAJ5770468.1 hypothetical protein N7511_002519 [Penicillium nucicola]